MRKALVLLLCIAVLCVLSACAEENAPAQETAQPTPVVEEAPPSKTPDLPMIALVMTGNNAFNQVLAEKIEPLVDEAGYRLETYYSASAEEQETDVYTAIGGGAEAIILMPVDMDNLQQVIEECDAQKIPVINILTPANGIVKILISQDYPNVGAQAAKTAAQLKPGAKVLTVEQEANPFIMQLIHDGFVAAALEEGFVTVEKSVIVGESTVDIFEYIKGVLELNEQLDLIYIQDESLTEEVVQAAEAVGREFTIVASGADAATLEMIASGRVDATLFASPRQLAELAALYVADENRSDQYAKLKTEIITQQNVSSYQADGGYADVLTDEDPEEAAPEEQETDDVEQTQDGDPEQTGLPDD
ncbi:MAG: sugar ABC transporter substrate-binding protein [Christensenellaceae bacterium]|jgi:ABC-type sugar transport system substrate-binding protein